MSIKMLIIRSTVLPSPQLMLANLHKRCRCQILIGPCKVSTLKWTINTAQAGGHETQSHTYTTRATIQIILGDSQS